MRKLPFQAFRLVTGLIFVLYVWYLFDEFFIHPQPFQVMAHRSQASPFNALLGLIFIGFPCLWYTIFGRVSHSKKLADLMAVEWDDEIVRVKVSDEMDPAYNQEFRWAEITRVCFKDEGLYGSDILLLDLKGREKPAIVLTEALHGSEFMGQLYTKKFFPDEIWNKAIRSTDGGMYCWPPKEQETQ